MSKLIVEHEYQGYKYTLTQEAIDKFQEVYQLDVTKEVERSIDLALRNIDIQSSFDLETGKVSIVIINKESPDASASP